MIRNLWVWHVHHTKLVETMWPGHGMPQRQDYIRREKPKQEQARRLRLMQPVQNQALVAALDAALKASHTHRSVQAGKEVRRAITRALEAQHKYECPKCPWNGLTIFPQKRRANG